MNDPYLKKIGPMLNYLETMISCGRFAPGEALPSLRKLAADFAISRLLGEAAFEEAWRRVAHPGTPARRIYQHGILRLLK